MADTPPVPQPRKPAPKKPAAGTRSQSGTSGTSGTPRSEAKTPPRATATGPKLQRQLEEFLVMPALLTSALGDEYPTQVIKTRAPFVAEAWYELSKESPAVKRVLENLTTGGAWGGVVVTSAAMILPVVTYYFGPTATAMDPFSGLFPPIELAPGQGAPIVPPPPAASPPRVSRPGGGATVETDDGPMTAPVAPDQPPGVVTVAGIGAVTNGTGH